MPGDGTYRQAVAEHNDWDRVDWLWHMSSREAA
jgi:hypothetical protein